MRCFQLTTALRLPHAALTQANVQRLKSYRSSLAIFPRRVNKPKVRHSHTGTEVTKASVGLGDAQQVSQCWGTKGVQWGKILFACSTGALQQ